MPLDLFNSTTFLAFLMPSGGEWIVLLVIGLLLFGRRLPEVGRSLGRGIVEFKKGIKGIDDEIEEASSEPSSRPLPDKSSEPRIARDDTSKVGNFETTESKANPG
jgi:sec-independent protein translocase protein TatA